MLIRLGVTVAMGIAASAFVFAGQSAAKADGCASAQPTWGFQCVAAASNISLANCMKEAPLWHKDGKCIQRNDGSGRYDLWIPSN
ncbi:hypothetical protein [Nocardia sp. NPDC004260]